MPDKREVVELVKRGKFVCKLDLKYAFFSILVHKDDRKYLGIHYKGEYYRWCRCPQGIRPSGMACQMITSTAAYNVSEDIIVFFDDFLLVAETYAHLLIMVRELIAELEAWGLEVNYNKSVLIPQRSEDLEYLRFVINMERESVRIKSELIGKMRTSVRSAAQQLFLSDDDLSKIQGVLNSGSPTLALQYEFKGVMQQLRGLCTLSVQHEACLMSLIEQCSQ
ncbi:hypothetical protein AKO1_002247, partial [Acrasis kona]